MIEPPINELMEKVDSRYTLVILAAKRAREIADEQNDPDKEFAKLVDCKSNKPVTIATHEIAKGMVSYDRSEGLKKFMNGEENFSINLDDLHEVDLYEEE